MTPRAVFVVAAWTLPCAGLFVPRGAGLLLVGLVAILAIGVRVRLSPFAWLAAAAPVSLYGAGLWSGTHWYFGKAGTAGWIPGVPGAGPIDPEYRLFWPRHDCLVGITDMYLEVGEGSATYAWARLLGPPHGAYVGVYPTDEEALATVLEHGYHLDGKLDHPFVVDGLKVDLDERVAEDVDGFLSGEDVAVARYDGAVLLAADSVLVGRVAIVDPATGTLLGGLEVHERLPREHRDGLRLALPDLPR